MQRLPRLLLVFAVLFTVMLLAPAFLNKQFGPYPLLKTGDIVDLFTPLVLIPIYWLVLQHSGSNPPSRRTEIIFMVLAAMWVEGQGLHLAANAIGHLVEGGDGGALTHFIDEELSHYVWHIGLFGLSALLVWHEWHNPQTGQSQPMWMTGVAALIYGLVYFIITTEAVTWALGVPFAIVMAGIGLIPGRGKLLDQPVLYFFTAAFAIAIVITIVWAIRWNGTPGCESFLPEFSDACVGMLD